MAPNNKTFLSLQCPICDSIMTFEIQQNQIKIDRNYTCLHLKTIDTLTPRGLVRKFTFNPRSKKPQNFTKSYPEITKKYSRKAKEV